MSTTTESAQLSFAQHVDTFASAQGRPPYELPHLEGTPMRAREQLVRWHGAAADDCREWVWPGRTVIEVPGRTWPVARPEDCTEESVIWFDTAGCPVLDPHAPGGVVLLCAGCGLDSS